MIWCAVAKPLLQNWHNEMKKAFLYCSLFIFSYSLAFAQSDSAKKQSKNKKAKTVKQGPSYIDANPIKAPPIRQNNGSDTAALKKNLRLKVVDKPVYGPVSADCPPDADLALKGVAGMYFEKPHSVAWFTFVVPEDTVLTFDLVPANGTDDLDFLLFKYHGDDFENAIKTHTIKPVRSNIAHSDLSLKGKTGLSSAGKNSYEPLGSHPAYCSVLKVKKGEQFYLAVDNYTNVTGAFSLYLHLRWPIQTPLVKPPHIVPLGNNINLNIIVVDSANKPVKTRLKIKLGATIEHERMFKDTSGISSYTLVVTHREYVKIVCIGTGYLMSQTELRVPDTGEQMNDTIHLSKIGAHKNMVLQDIQFEPDQSIFLPEAREPLFNLFDFMQSNPTVHILVKGYVNDPLGVNEGKYDQNLSEARAKAVVQFLIQKGIESSRMDWKGFGNKDMLYPNPQNWEEQQANRRVEIEVK